QARCNTLGFECHVSPSRMGELIAGADLSIGAGGTTTWERCCLGLPTLAISTASNQVRQVADAAREGLIFAPQIEGDLTEAMYRHLSSLVENQYLRESMSRRGMEVVDGGGV